MAILKTRLNNTWTNSSRKGKVRFGGVDITIGSTGASPVSLFTPGSDEPSGTFDEGVPITLGTGMAFSVAGTITHGKYRCPTTPIGTYEYVLYRITGATTGLEVARATLTAVSNTWVTVALPSPVAVTANTGYYACIYTTSGRYSARGTFFNTANKVNGVLTGWQTGTNYLGDATRNNGTFGSGNVYPTGSFNGTCYYTDVVFQPS
jgi:hypothetical protein